MSLQNLQRERPVGKGFTAGLLVFTLQRVHLIIEDPEEEIRSWLKLLSITFQVNDASISLDRQSRPAAVDYAFNVVSIMKVVYR